MNQSNRSTSSRSVASAFAVTLTLLLAFDAALAQEETEPREERLGRLIETHDMDGDGSLSMDERDALHADRSGKRESRQTYGLDRHDGDRRLSDSERDSAREGGAKPGRQDGKHRGGGGVTRDEGGGQRWGDEAGGRGRGGSGGKGHGGGRGTR